MLTNTDSPRELISQRRRDLLLAISQPQLLLAGGIKFGSPEIPELPGSKTEIEDIDSLAAKHNIRCRLLTGDEASKPTIMKLLHESTSAHLATHGFFANTAAQKEDWREAIGLAARSRSGPNVNFVSSSRNLLLTSGLYVARSKETQNDSSTGKITAEELIGIDMSKMDLITLSACETGRGEEVNGQGIIGLRSALLAAGARSIMMSLWKVPDTATQKLMEKFYRRLWSGNVTKAQALSLAQQELRDDPSGDFKHPWYWAAWVLVGEGW